MARIPRKVRGPCPYEHTTTPERLLLFRSVVQVVQAVVAVFRLIGGC